MQPFDESLYSAGYYSTNNWASKTSLAAASKTSPFTWGLGAMTAAHHNQGFNGMISATSTTTTSTTSSSSSTSTSSSSSSSTAAAASSSSYPYSTTGGYASAAAVGGYGSGTAAATPMSSSIASLRLKARQAVSAVSSSYDGNEDNKEGSSPDLQQHPQSAQPQTADEAQPCLYESDSRTTSSSSTLV